MHVFITGGTRGIGLGLVKEFLKLGHEVSFTGTSQGSIDKIVNQLEGNYTPYVLDVRDYEALKSVKDKAVEKYHCIDIWINNAGVNQTFKPVSELTQAEIKDVIDVNITGMIYGTAIALEEMKKQNYGTVYNMEGLGSNNMIIPNTVIYGSTKHLLTYFSKGANKELKQYKNIRVGRLSPGMVFTDFLRDHSGQEGSKIKNILGNHVEVVTPFLVKKMINGNLKINWLTNRKVMLKFMKSIIVKPKKVL